MISGLVADDIDDGYAGAPGVMEVRESIREAGSTVEERRRGLPGYPCIAVRRAGRNVFEQRQYTPYAWNAVQRRNEVHLTRSRVGKACIDVIGDERADQAFGAVH
jgi:hypothetical protein